MKNSRILLILFASILLIIPTARATTIPNSATLISGTVSLYGTVNVSDLQNNQGNQNNVERAPLHAQGEQAFQQAKDQANSNGFIPADEGTKTVTAPATATPLTPTVFLSPYLPATIRLGPSTSTRSLIRTIFRTSL